MNRVIQGDCRDVMRSLIAEGVRVQCCVTSPPYFGLRDYGHSAQIGLERTCTEYVAAMVDVFDLVRQMLADDGVLWLNLGDSYATGAGKAASPGGGAQGEKFLDIGPAGYRGGHAESPKHAGRSQVPDAKNPGAGIPLYQPNRMPQPGLKPKDLMGMPWRVAFALQDAGWWLRQDIVWAKGNPMPESVRDRFCKSHEYIYLMTKGERYYFDLDAVLEPCQSGPSDLKKMAEQLPRIGGKHKDLNDPLSKASSTTNIGQKRSVGGMRASGNKERKFGEDRDRPGSHLGASIPWEGFMRTPRSVWNVNTQPYKGAHFATMPEEIVERAVLASTKPGDIVFDPFMGSGTVASVAQRLGRRWLGSELNGEYIKLIEQRTRGTMGLELA